MKELKAKLAKLEAQLDQEYIEQNLPGWSDFRQLRLQQMEDDYEELKEEIYGF